MTGAQKLKCAAYGLLSLAALVFTTVQLKTYLPLGLVEGNIQFWRDTMVNPASRFITLDIFFVFAAVWPWMVGEARRWKMSKYGWYLPAAALISFSATLPIFMIHREVMMARQADAGDVGRSGGWDRLSVALAAVTPIAYALWIGCARS